jgi:hypothetical protein
MKRPPKTKRLTVLVEPERFDEITRTATDHGLTLGEYVRAALDEFDIRARL